MFAAIASSSRVAPGSVLQALTAAERDGLMKTFRRRHPEMFGTR